jgi:hypothetical protein
MPSPCHEADGTEAVPPKGQGLLKSKNRVPRYFEWPKKGTRGAKNKP